MFNVDINRYPESIEDVAGKVRPDELQADLAILHKEMLKALEAEGVTADQLPVMLVNDITPNTGSRGFFPSENMGRIQIFNMKSPTRVVLTELSTGDGYVLTIPFNFLRDSSDEILMADFVINVKLLEELEKKRQAAGSGYKLMNKEFVEKQLMPNLNVDFGAAFFGPFGELREEYLPYKGKLVEADSGTSEDEIYEQIEAGRVFVVAKLNLYK